MGEGTTVKPDLYTLFSAMDGGQGFPQIPRGCLAILSTGLDDVLLEKVSILRTFQWG